MNMWKSVAYASLTAVLVACHNAPRDPQRDDSPTFGHVAVLADRDFRLVLEDLQFSFNATYPDAQVDVYYLSDDSLRRAMLADSVRVVFAALEPGAEQEAYFRTRSLTVRSEAVTTDGITVVVAPGSPLQAISVSALRGLLAGEATTGAGAPGGTALLIDGPGMARSLVDSLLGGDPGRLKGRVFTSSSTADLVQRVAADPEAIGLLSFATISDLDDGRCRALREGVRILPVSGAVAATAVLPGQGTLKDGSYPLRRKLNMIVTEGKSGLGTGFASFVAGHKGQRIILKQGLPPERVPAREVEIVQP